MKTNPIATRIIAGVLPAMALFATPALAQIATQTAPPPVPAAAAPVPEPAPPAAQAAPDQSKYQASLDAATGKTAGADAPAAAAASPSRAARAARAAPVRPVQQRATPVAVTPAPAPVAAAVPAVAPAPAPVAAASPAAQPAPAEPVAATTTEANDTTVAQTTSGTPIWVWLLAGLAGLAVIALGVLALRRRSASEEWVEEEPYVEAAPVAEAAPLAYDEPVAEHADVVAPAADEVAAMTEAAAPVAGRPWIELSLRPIRAGATDESALVDLELTLANAGAETAKDVRVSTFMLGDATDAPTNLERLLAKGSGGAEVDAGSIAAGEGSRIDARLAVPREGMDGATFQPLVGVDVRYTLPDGSEGRTAAAFTVGVDDDTDTPTPIRLGGDMREDVAATLHGVPERV